MHASTPIVMTFLLLGGILVAPHLDWPAARSCALTCLFFALLFWWAWPD